MSSDVKRVIGSRPANVEPTVTTYLLSAESVLSASAHIDEPVHISADAGCCSFWGGHDLLGFGILQSMPHPFSHVAEAAFLVLPLTARRYVPDIYYVAREMLVDGARQRFYSRVQCHVAADSPTQIHFAQRLGFVAEGLLRKFGPGATDMYSMFLEGI